MNPLKPASTPFTQPHAAESGNPTTAAEALPSEPVLPVDGVSSRLWQTPPPLPTAEELAPAGEPVSVSKPADDSKAGAFLFPVTVFLLLILIGEGRGGSRR
jgi:hypothetical protein